MMFGDSSVSQLDAAQASERAFRRGFMQGYVAALDDVDAGKSKDELNSFVNTALREWREGDCDIRQSPPVIKVTAPHVGFSSSDRQSRRSLEGSKYFGIVSGIS